jgi:hypothetical protein
VRAEDELLYFFLFFLNSEVAGVGQRKQQTEPYLQQSVNRDGREAECVDGRAALDIRCRGVGCAGKLKELQTADGEGSGAPAELCSLCKPVWAHNWGKFLRRRLPPRRRQSLPRARARSTVCWVRAGATAAAKG